MPTQLVRWEVWTGLTNKGRQPDLPAQCSLAGTGVSGVGVLVYAVTEADRNVIRGNLRSLYCTPSTDGRDSTLVSKTNRKASMFLDGKSEDRPSYVTPSFDYIRP